MPYHIINMGSPWGAYARYDKKVSAAVEFSAIAEYEKCCNSGHLIVIATFFFFHYCASFYSGFKVTLFLPVFQDFGIPVAQSIRVTAPKQYSASEISHFIKVLHGASIFFDGTDPFSLTEVPDNLALNDQLLKEDQDRNHCFVLPSSIDHESAGDGLYSGI